MEEELASVESGLEEDECNPNEKPCPKCCETIKTMAVKCKHCGSDLSPPLGKMGAGTGAVVGTFAGCGTGTLIGMCMAIAGSVLCMTAIGAIVGIPMILLGILVPFITTAGGGLLGVGAGITDKQLENLKEISEINKERELCPKLAAQKRALVFVLFGLVASIGVYLWVNL